jgi:plasmid replication initiation protein
MPRPKRAQPDAPLPLPGPLEEGNFSRLGMFSVQERIPSTFTSWTRVFEGDNASVSFTCTSPAELGGVPHGIDAEFMQTLINLYIEGGAPANGEVNVGMREALERSGCDTSGHYCALLRESLQRMRGALYTANNAWVDSGRRRKVSTTFNLLSDLTILERGSSDENLNTTRIVARFPPEIIANIRERYTRHLDFRLLANLKRSSSRILYRLLEGRRYNADDLEPTRLERFTVGLQAWAEELKLVTREASKIRSLLEPLHGELIENGFLTSATFEGRGARAAVTYVYALPKSAFDSVELERLRRAEAVLKSYGFNRYWIERHAGAHSLEAILEADAAFREVAAHAANPIRNRTGYFTKILQQAAVFESPPPSAAAAPARSIPAAKPQPDDDPNALFEALPRKQQIEEVLNALAYPLVVFEIPAVHVARLRLALLGSQTTPLAFKRQMLELMRRMDALGARAFVAEIVALNDLAADAAEGIAPTTIEVSARVRKR